MKTQVPLKQAIGKTVARIYQEPIDPVIIFFWTDETFSAIKVTGSIAGEGDLGDMILSLEPDPTWGSSLLWWPAKLVELGIATDVEIKEAQAKAEAKQKEIRDAQERARFLELKAKFEGAT